MNLHCTNMKKSFRYDFHWDYIPFASSLVLDDAKFDLKHRFCSNFFYTIHFLLVTRTTPLKHTWYKKFKMRHRFAFCGL